MTVKKGCLPILMSVLMVLAFITVIPVKTANADSPTVNGIIYQENADGTYSAYWFADDTYSNVKIEATINGKPVTAISQNAFNNKDTIQTVMIPPSVKEIGERAFYDCNNITSVTFEEGSQLERFGSYTFSQCSKLKSIKIPNSMTSLGFSAFSNSGLESVSFESGSRLETIDKSTFFNCKGLGRITVPKNVKNISEGAFKGSSISSISFEQGSELTSVEQNAFMECSNLKKIVFPADVTAIGMDTIRDSGVSSISFEAGSQLTNIGDYTFEYCSSLKEVTIPASVVQIGNMAFRDDDLTSVRFESESGLTTIGGNAFLNNRNLKDVSIPKGVKVIGSGAFGNTSLSAVTLPDSITNIGSEALKCGSGLLIHYYGSEDKWNEVSKEQNWTDSSNPVHFIEIVTLKATPELDGGRMYACTTPGCGVRGEMIEKVSRPYYFNLSVTAYTYDGSAKTPAVTEVKDEDGATISAADYKISYSNNVNAGNTAKVVVAFDSEKYTGTKTVSFTISKAANPLKIGPKTAAVKYSKLKKKAQTLKVSKVIKFTKKGQGTMQYKLYSAKKGKKSFKKYFKVAAKSGKVTIKKGLKKGKYKVKVKVKAAGNANYKASGLKTVTFVIKVK